MPKPPSPIIRTRYADPDDLLTRIPTKRGRVLHALRKYAGEAAFWEALQQYLRQHAYQAVEPEHLRQAFEAVTGQDLRWFFEQWFFAPGHPELAVQYQYDAAAQSIRLHLHQIQDSLRFPVFQLPLPVRYWANDQHRDTLLWLKERSQTYALPSSWPPQALWVDEGFDLPMTVRQSFSSEEAAFVYAQHPRLATRWRVLQSQALPTGQEIYQKALQDAFWGMRAQALLGLGSYRGKNWETWAARVIPLALQDPVARVRSTALDVLAIFPKPALFLDTFHRCLSDSSYEVRAAALWHYWQNGGAETEKWMEKYAWLPSRAVAEVVASYYLANKRLDKADWLLRQIRQSDNWSDYTLLEDFAAYLKKCPEAIEKQGVEVLKYIVEKSGTDWHRLAAFNALYPWRNQAEVAALRDKYREELEKVFLESQED
ncbi:MAG: hypothetical protein HC913_05535 [Microscillaceae bacterium]|nr:hypothetical protein [Microscillaceae bacterium]